MISVIKEEETMSEFEKLKQELLQKKERIKQTAQKVGLTALIGLSVNPALSENTSNSPSSDANNIIKETTISPQKNTDNVAIYIQNTSLTHTDPIYQPKKLGSKFKAYYQSNLNQGQGGIVINQYSMTDSEAFLHAKQTHSSKFSNVEDAIGFFSKQAKNYGYDKEIKTLKNVDECLNSYAQKTKRKDKIIEETLYQNATDAGLTGALNTLRQINSLNQSNMAEIKHEKLHAENKEFMTKIATGEVLLSPGGKYLVHMADELRAQILGNNISPTAEGIDTFFKEFGDEYKQQYTTPLDNDESYKRLFAISLNEEKSSKTEEAFVNNEHIPHKNSSEAKDNKGNEYTINAFETDKYVVFFGKFDDHEIKDVSFSNGKKISLNCLYDKNNNPILDKNNNKCKAVASRQDSDFVISYETPTFATKDMDKNLTFALSSVLQNTPEDIQKLILESLNKYCKDDAIKEDQYAINNKDIERLRNETSKENTQYIISQRKKHFQNQKADESNLQRLNAPKTYYPNINDFNR